jgi:hypothetical protein
MSTDIAELRRIVDRGLTAGIGDQNMTCIEGAIALASGEPLSDAPSCVHDVDRAFAIRLNDALWLSPRARGQALLPLALAQLGTAGADRRAWTERVVLGTVRRVLPMALRAVGLSATAERCAQAEDLAQAEKMANEAAAAARKARTAAEAAAEWAAPAEWAATAARKARNAARAARKARKVAEAEWALAQAAAEWVLAAAAEWAASAAWTASAAAGESVLREAVAVALEAYRAEGRA